MTKTPILAVLCVMTPLACAQAQDVASFYRDRTVSLTIGYPPGGGFDTSARILLRHMPRHIPGQPAIVPKNMPGAGSLVAANYLYNVAPKDGTEFGIIGGSVPFGAIWSREGVKFESERFGWIGSLDRWNGIALIWREAPVKTLADAQRTDVPVGATGAGDVTAIYPRVLNTLLGTRFVVSAGYRGTRDLNLAIERGEVHGRLGWCWSCVKADKPDWIADGKVRAILQFGIGKDPDLPDAPHIFDLAKSEEDRQIMRLVFGSQEMARPFVAPPGLPADRLAALRNAFEKTAGDPEFLAEAAKTQTSVNITRWQEMEKLLRDVAATPPAVVERAARLVGG